MYTDITEIELKVTLARVEGLYQMHEYMLAQFNPENNLENLLHAHVLQMYWRLEDMLNQKNVKKGKKKNFTLKINAADALAFCLFWGNEQFSVTTPGAVEVVRTINEIDKATKKPETLYEH